MKRYRNIKNGNIYIAASEEVINATNKDDGMIMVLYYPEDKEGMYFVRELEEFKVKFELID